jgi:DNA-binding GntR family transcriptional regulator
MNAKRATKRNTTPLARADTRSLREQVYDKIKLRIITFRYRPGEYLNESQISKALRLGRTPVHQALSQLKLEGLVEILPRKGVIVKPISLDEAQDIIQARLVNEALCARLAAQRATQENIAELARIIERSGVAASAGDIERLMFLDRDFHHVLGRASRNTVLAQILGQLHNRLLRFWFVSLTDRKHHIAVLEEHKRVLDAVRARDADAAETAIREHILSFQQNIHRQV